MTLEKGVTDDQLGRYYRRTAAIADRLGKSLSYDGVMDVMQRLHDKTLRTNRNTAEDLQELCSRPLGAANMLKLIRETLLPEVAGMPLDLCFVNRHRYPEPMWVHDDLKYKSLDLQQPGQAAGMLRVYAVSGKDIHCLSNDTKVAAELLGVSEEVPTKWLQRLLIQRGCTLTLPAIEYLIEKQMQGTDLGLLPYRSDPCYRPRFRAFVATGQDTVDTFICYRNKRKQWKVYRSPFLIDGVGGGSTNMGDTRIVVHSPL